MRRWGWAVLAVVLGLAGGGLPAGAAVASPKPLRIQWWFESWQVRELLWPRTQGEGVTVAVLDTGVQADLPEFRGAAVLPGADVTGGGTDGRVDRDRETGEVAGHGTSMAAMIVAQGTGTGYLGIAPKAKILPVTVNSDGPHGDSGLNDVDGVRYAVDHGAKVISISQASPVRCVPSMQEAVSYAIEHDVVVVAGAGNDGDEGNQSQMPANCAGVVAVGAVGVHGDTFGPWDQTQRQPYVAVGAAGEHTPVLLRDGTVQEFVSGTSTATALTSGVLALVRSAFPDMRAREVVRLLIGSCLDVAPKGKDNQTGYGMIRPNRMLTGNVPKGGPNPVFEAYDKWKAENDALEAESAPAPVAEPSSKAEERIIVMVLAGVGALVVVLLLVSLTRRGRSRRTVGPPSQ